MKKILISMMAVAALAACSKSDINYDAPAEIGFTPVAKMNTKAAVNTTDYPNKLNMYVFANAGAADAENTSSYSEVYFKNACFANKSGEIFGGSPTPYYWPNVKELIFSGVSDSGNVNETDGSVPTYAYANNKWEITLKNYAPGVGTDALGDNDLMWFPTTIAYGKNDVIGEGKTGHIDVTMKHACSWITINIKGDATTGAANTTWKVNSLVINNLSLSGTAVLSETASWNNLGTANGSFEVFTPSSGTNLTNEYVALENITNNTIVIPQNTTSLTIEYEYVSQPGAGEGGADIVITEEKTIPLAYSGGTAWQPGVHYTYNITIGTTEILIEPTATAWDSQTVTPDIAL